MEKTFKVTTHLKGVANEPYSVKAAYINAGTELTLLLDEDQGVVASFPNSTLVSIVDESAIVK
jgi:hypothetical protein